MLRDAENEVRIVAIRSLKNMIKLLSSEKAGSLVSYISSMTKDTISLVRLGSCEVLIEILKSDLSAFDKDYLKNKM